MASKFIYNAPAMVEKNELHDDDIVLEGGDEYAQNQDFELEVEEELTGDKLKALRQKLKVCESEKMDALEEQGRIRADFLNSKRRLEEQFKTDKERIVERVVEDFLPLIDSFETALVHKGDATEDVWEKGIQAMHGQFLSILKSYNVTEIETEGKHFNPHEHEAVTARKGENDEATDTVLQVLQKGYKRGDTIIRPAKVVLAE
jgi:molecular chaperone GrpE